MIKKQIPDSPYSVNPGCKWCNGTGSIAIPNYSQVLQYGKQDQCLDGNWVGMPKSQTLCHKCYDTGTPEGSDGYPLRTLLDSVKWAKDKSDLHFELLLSCLKWSLISRHTELFTNDMISELLRLI